MAESGNKDKYIDADFDDDAAEMKQLDEPLRRKKTAKPGPKNGKKKPGSTVESGQGRTGAAGNRAGAGRGQAGAGRGQAGAGRGQATAGRGQAAAGRGQAAAGRGQAAAGRGQAAAGRGQTAADRGQTGAAGRRSASNSENRKNYSAAESRRRPVEVRRDRRTAAVYDEMPVGEKKEDSIIDDIVIILISLLCILMVLSYCGVCGQFGVGVNVVVFGLFGRLGYVLPFLIFIITVFFMANKGKNARISKIVYSLLFLCVIAGLVQLIAGGYDPEVKLGEYFTFSRIDIAQAKPAYGGISGGALVCLLCPYVGKAAAIIIFIALMLILFVLSTGKAFITYLSRKINRKAHNIYENKKLERQERRYYRDASEDDGDDVESERYQEGNDRRNKKRRRMGTIEVVTGKNDNAENDTGLDEEENSEFEDPGHLSAVTKDDYRKYAAEEEDDPSIGFLDRLKNRNSQRDRKNTKPDSPAPESDSRDRDRNKKNSDDREVTEELKQLEKDTLPEEKSVDSAASDFTSDELDRKFGNKPSIDLISLRQNPNPVKPTTRMYINTDEDNNILRMPISKRLHAGSSNLEEDNEAVSYRIHGLDNSDRDKEQQADDKEAEEKRDFASEAEERPDFPETSEKITFLKREIINPDEDWDDIQTQDDYDGDDTQAQDDYDGISGITDIKGFSDNVQTADQGEADNGAEAYDDENDDYSSTKIVSFRKPDTVSEPEAVQTEAGQQAEAGQVRTEAPAVKTIPEPAAYRDSSGAVRFTDMNAKPAASSASGNANELPEYQLPPVSLLAKGRGRSGSNAEIKEELENTIALLQETFESFGVGVTVTDASIGPTVTRYEVLPNKGVKVKTITSLSDDLKLALAAPEIRIEAPIPGKAAVGIEVPNKTSEPVLFGDLIDSDAFRKSKSKISFAVGKDISGENIVSNIGSMPHALIAGATGSGKSVCINALIMSILYKAKPTEVKMIMVDPKRVELVGYNGIPHLLVPVVTDVKKASGALNWALAEMDNRYQLFADNAVTNLASYNKYVEEKYHEEGNEGECPDKLPQILIIIDELNDLMMTANSKDVEAAICRLTQLARACGIHVILATQRPSVNVLTGTIKANIPTRIAFSVSSIVDSRTILDQQGAEKLLGKGDMLFYPAGYVKPVRVQGVYVSDDEVKNVVSFIKDQCRDYKYNDTISKHIDSASEAKSNGQSASAADDQGSSGNGRDEYFNVAGRFIIEKQKASIGSIQRVYSVGFNRAARIMDQLAAAGVVGPEEGTKTRKILMTAQEFEDMIASEENGGQNN